MNEIDNILRILVETKKAIETGNYSEIKNLSNQTINTASLTQDPDNIMVAVVIYSLSKILGRKNYRELKGWENFHKTIINSLNNSIKYLNENKLKEFRAEFEKIRKAIENLSGKLKKYIQDVFRKASINKASKIYEHGISMEKTAKLLGISMFELASYAGQTEISDVPLGKTLDTKKRIKLVIDIFS